MSTPEEEKESLNKNIIKLSETIHEINSYKLVFLRGIINGVGTFIGATVVATIVITILIKIFGFLGVGDYFDSFLPKGN